MKTVGALLVLGMLVGAWVSAVPSPGVRLPFCDAPDVEEAAVAALDYINSFHKHGFKYALNRIEKAKIVPMPTGEEVYLLELDLLQTKCHVLDPTPLANCTIRQKIEMTVEGDCDVAVKKDASGVLSPKAFKCKSEPDSREDMCAGCPILLPLNHTEALQVVDVSVGVFNEKANASAAFALMEVARLTSQVVGGGAKLDAEFVLVETNCSSDATEGCVPLQGPEAHYAVCHASSAPGSTAASVNCKIFQIHMPPVAPAANETQAAVHPVPLPLPVPGAAGHMHHHLTHIHLHDPSATGLLSESTESAEVPVVKRDVPADIPPPEVMGPGPQLCPGRLRHF